MSKKKRSDVVCGGWDLALNHSAYVELTNGKLTNFWYITERAGSANQHKNGIRLVYPAKIKKTKDVHFKSISRLAFIRETIVRKIIKNRPDYVGIENYAYGAEQGAHQMGEVGSIARMILWSAEIPYRLHDPLSVKMFATHDGSCSKEYVRESVEKRWGISFDEYNQPLKAPTKNRPDPKQDLTTSEDLSDAFAVAQLVWTEVQLRNGWIALSDLHPKEIQVFNRVTKTYPVSLLAREWICKESL